MKRSILSVFRRRFPIHPAVMAAALTIASSAPLHADDVLFLENFENPDVPSYSQGITPDIWVRAAQGYGSGDHGMTDKSGGDFSAPAGNDQAYAFRYTNSGITTKEKALGSPLIFGGGYEVSFDVVKDNSNGGTAYNVNLVAFGAGAARDDCRSIPSGSTLLASKSGSASTNGSITTVKFSFIPNATTHAAEFGKDLGIRVLGGFNYSIIDNIKFRAIPGTGAGLSLVTTSPLDNSGNNMATKPVKAIFSKNIAAGSGNVTLRNLTDTTDTIMPVSDSRITLSGTCLDILPGPHLTWNKNYAVLVDSGAIIETPGGTPFTGISNDTTWNFTTAGGDPLLYSISQLKSHINGTITLTAAEIDTIKRNLDSEVGRFAESSASITALLDLVSAYDTSTVAGRKGPLWVVTGLPKRDAVTNDLHWTMFNVMQNIMDRIYTAQTLASHEALLNNFKFGSSSNFPGACAAPAPNTYAAVISGSYLNTYGPPIIQDGPGTFARKPTGTYLAPGTIATVTVPPSMVGTGYKIRVGCHSWDFGAKPDIKRLDRATRVYDITALETKIANPLGGGIYIEVPFLANAGVVTVNISGAVRSPFFSAKSFHVTTSAQWLTERVNPAPWADFQSDKFMMQVPKSWVSSMTGAQAIQLMADWDASMDAINDLMGYPHICGKETMYPQVDLLLKNSVYAPGYPSVNTTYSPSTNYGGYANSHLVRGPQNAPDYEFHEQGHGYLFPKFAGETEANVNLLHVAVMNRKFGKTMDEAFRTSRGYTRTYMTLDTTAMAWMCVFNFSPREVPMNTSEKAYQLKGHAKFVDIADLYGWGVLDAFWKSMVDLDETNTAYATDDDAMLLRLCKAVGKDIRPLFHFWGIHPSNPGTLAANIAAANIPADPAIKSRLLYYKTLVPANNSAFQTFALAWWGKQPTMAGNWEEREHARQWDTTPLYGVGDQQRSEATNPGEIYNENSANDIRNRVQELVDLYFSDTTPPTISTLGPADNASGVELAADFVVTFNEAIALGAGNITIRNLTNLSQTTIAVTDATQVSLSGAVLTISPTTDPAGGMNYAIRIDGGAVRDTSNNPFAGIADDTTWNFATVVPGTIGSGGTITYTDSSGLNPRSSPTYPGGYVVHTFTGSGTLVMPFAVSADYLVVAGGGGGGMRHGGGGGSGGLLAGSTSLTAQSYAITVGAGGAGANSSTDTLKAGSPGANSVFGAITAIGGGGGRTYSGTYTGAGGSGGGGAGVVNTAGGTPTSDQGFAGGSGSTTPSGSGGGGAGGMGSPGTANGGQGGNGVQSSISGVASYYGGGGGGGGDASKTGGAGGLGGGGHGGDNGLNTSQTAGTGGTGGGGGGCRSSSVTAPGSAGGSGVVIVRYALPETDPYAVWSGGGAFDADSNNDGMKDGLAWLLGAANPSAAAADLLPKPSESAGNLVLNFICLKVAKRGSAVLRVQYSNDLDPDAWAGHEAVVPDVSSSVNGVVFIITANANPDLINVQAEIPAIAAAPGTMLFGRLNAAP